MSQRKDFCRQKVLNNICVTYEWPLEFQRRRASPDLLAALFVTLIAAILTGLDARAAKLRSDCKAWSQVSFWTPSPPPPMWAESKSTMCKHYEFWKSGVPSENCSHRKDKVKVTVVTDPLCLLSPTNTNSSLSISSKAAAPLPAAAKVIPPPSSKTSKANTSEASKRAKLCLTHWGKKFCPNPLLIASPWFPAKRENFEPDTKNKKINFREFL